MIAKATGSSGLLVRPIAGYNWPVRGDTSSNSMIISPGDCFNGMLNYLQFLKRKKKSYHVSVVYSAHEHPSPPRFLLFIDCSASSQINDRLCEVTSFPLAFDEQIVRDVPAPIWDSEFPGSRYLGQHAARSDHQRRL